MATITTWNDDLEQYDIYGMSAYDERARCGLLETRRFGIDNL
jgi:hypothetical protein